MKNELKEELTEALKKSGGKPVILEMKSQYDPNYVVVVSYSMN